MVSTISRWAKNVASPLIAGVLLALALHLPASGFTLIDVLSSTPRSVVSYCIASTPPGVTVARAKVLLDSAIASWHAASGPNTARALSLSQDDPCQTATHVRVRAGALPAGTIAVVNLANTTITFNNSYEFWDGIGIQGERYSYQGILAHEMGHSLGLGHAGGTKWSYDGYLPTMAQCGSYADSAAMATIQQDDWGGAAYLRGGTPRYWSANPGFEADFSHWARSSTTDVTVGSAYALTGNRGVRMASSGNWMYITSVYDPYHPINDPVDNMSTNPSLRVLGWYKHPSAGTTGGVQVQYDYRYLRYEQSSAVWCKRDADDSATHTAWFGVENLRSCGDPGTIWTSCEGGVTIPNSTINDATVFRAYIRSTSSGAAYVDKVGAYGGTSP